VKRTLDAEDRFERIEKGETSATNPGAKSGSITGKDRGPLQFRQQRAPRLDLSADRDRNPKPLDCFG
jgi:hypothetical protein